MADRAQAEYLADFRRDIQDILAWSEDQFGSTAADRYGSLIRQAIRDVVENPLRPGTKTRPDLAPNAYVYHLMFSHDLVTGRRVKTPRHFIVYRYADGPIEFARLLHDSRDLLRHLPSGYGM